MAKYLGGAYTPASGFQYDPTYADQIYSEYMQQQQAQQQQSQAPSAFGGVESLLGGGSAFSSEAPSAFGGVESMLGLGGGSSLGSSFAPGVSSMAPNGLMLDAVTGEAIGTAATPAAAGFGTAAASPWALSGIGTAGNYLGPIGGAIGGADLLFNGGNYSEGSGALQGALSGAAMGSYFGPVGMAVGGGVGGLLGLGRTMFDKGPRTEVEDGRVRSLSEKGVTGYDQIFQPTKDKNAWYNPSLGADFIGVSPDGTWTNNKFAKSRNESDLRPEDVWGYSAWGEKFGNEWLGTSEENRRKIAEEALRRGLISESRGSINLRSDGSFDQFARDQLDGKSPTAAMKKPTGGSTSGASTPGVAAGGVGKTLDRIPIVTKIPQNTKEQTKPFKPALGSGAFPQRNIKKREDNGNPRFSWRIPVANYSGKK